MKLVLDDITKNKKVRIHLLASKQIISPSYRVDASLSVEVDLITNEVAFIVEDFENEKVIQESRISLAIEAYNKINGEKNERD